jgi:hypothetical protein
MTSPSFHDDPFGWLRYLVDAECGAELLEANMHTVAAPGASDAVMVTMRVRFPVLEPGPRVAFDPATLPLPAYTWREEEVSHSFIISGQQAMTTRLAMLALTREVKRLARRIGDAVLHGLVEPRVPHHDDDPEWRDRAPDLTEYVTGARVLMWIAGGETVRDPTGRALVHGPALVSTGAGMRAAHRWHAGHALQAECLIHELDVAPRLSIGPDGTAQAAEPHAAPAEGCHCGFNAYHDVDTLLTHADPANVGDWNVVALVRAWGQLEVHEHGFRSEWVEPVAIVGGVSEHSDAARAAAEHAGLPLVAAADATAFAAEHGAPVPMELRPVDETIRGLRDLITTTSPVPPLTAPRPGTGPGCALISVLPNQHVLLYEGDRIAVLVNGQTLQLGYDAQRQEPRLISAPQGWWIEPRPRALVIGDPSGPLLEIGFEPQ